MSPNKQWFQGFKHAEIGVVLLGNDNACKVLSTGTIRLHLASRQQTLIQEIRYVPELKRNLISIGIVDRQGYNMHVSKGTMKVCKDL